MFFNHPFQTKVAALFAACCVAFAVNGSILLGFDGLASQAGAAAVAASSLSRVAAHASAGDATPDA